MNCKKVKKLIPMYIEDALSSRQVEQIEDHTSVCFLCCEEIKKFRQSWEMLGDMAQVSPRPDYISKFWTEASSRLSLIEKLQLGLKEFFGRKQLVYAISSFCVVVLIVSSFSLTNRAGRYDQVLARLSSDDIEMLEEIELASNFEVIEHLDFLDNIELIEAMESFEI